MKQLEIIHLRSSGRSIESLCAQIAESTQDAAGDTEFVTLYRRDGLGTDVAIHISHSEESRSTGLTGLGIRLASALRTYGLVEHSLWEEVK